MWLRIGFTFYHIPKSCKWCQNSSIIDLAFPLLFFTYFFTLGSLWQAAAKTHRRKLWKTFTRWIRSEVNAAHCKRSFFLPQINHLLTQTLCPLRNRLLCCSDTSPLNNLPVWSAFGNWPNGFIMMSGVMQFPFWAMVSVAYCSVQKHINAQAFWLSRHHYSQHTHTTKQNKSNQMGIFGRKVHNESNAEVQKDAHNHHGLR